jgi:Prolyl oligopeptidase family
MQCYHREWPETSCLLQASRTRRYFWNLFFPYALLGLCGYAQTLAQQPLVANHKDLMHYVDGSGQLAPIRTAEDWRLRRNQILMGLQQVMGTLPDRTALGDVSYKVLTETNEEKYIRKKLEIDVGQGDKVLAWLLIPKRGLAGLDSDHKEKCESGIFGEEQRNTNDDSCSGFEQVSHEATSNRLPAVLALHQTNGRLGKDEVVGLSGSKNLHYGRELAERGYVVLAPDYPSLGEYDYDFDADAFESGSMKGIWNHMRCIDLLCSLEMVDKERIAAVGHSLGGHNAIFLAVFDERIRVTISSCGWTPFHDYYDGKLEGWAGERYMPRIQSEYQLDADKVPFDFYELVAAIAPRCFFSCSPTHDDNFDVNGVRKAIMESQKIFKLHGVEDHLQVRYPDSQHDFPADVRHEAYRYLDRWMAPAETTPPTSNSR